MEAFSREELPPPVPRTLASPPRPPPSTPSHPPTPPTVASRKRRRSRPPPLPLSASAAAMAASAAAAEEERRQRSVVYAPSLCPSFYDAMRQFLPQKAAREFWRLALEMGHFRLALAWWEQASSNGWRLWEARLPVLGLVRLFQPMAKADPPETDEEQRLRRSAQLTLRRLVVTDPYTTKRASAWRHVPLHGVALAWLLRYPEFSGDASTMIRTLLAPSQVSSALVARWQLAPWHDKVKLAEQRSSRYVQYVAPSWWEEADELCASETRKKKAGDHARQARWLAQQAPRRIVDWSIELLVRDGALWGGLPVELWSSIRAMLDDEPHHWDQVEAWAAKGPWRQVRG